MENELLCPGKIGAVGDEEIDIVSNNDEKMPLYFYNTPVKLNIFSNTHGRFAFGGNLYISNEDFWRISNLELYDRFEKRSFFRVRTDAKATLLLHPEIPIEPARVLHRLVKIQLIDISLCGIGFLAEHAFEVGENFLVRTLKLAHDDANFSFTAQIRRIGDTKNGSTIYGASIEKIEERDMDRMCRIIFNLQREEIQKRRGKAIH